MLIIVFATLLLSFFASIYREKSVKEDHLKVFSFYLGITVVIEFIAFWAFRWLGFQSNNFLYNLFMLAEGTLIFVYFFLLIRFKNLRRWMVGALILFWVVSVTSSAFLFGWSKWNSYMAISEAVMVSMFCIAYYYTLFTGPAIIELRYSTEFWIATGLLIYFACDLPYLGTLNYLNKSHPLLAKNLLKVLQILNIKVQLETQEETFQQIAQELHDNVGQLLSSTKILLVITERRLPEPPETLLTATRTLSKAIEDMRLLTKSLSGNWLGRGMGIMNMRNRIRLLGGEMYLESAPGMGTSITIQIPQT